MLYMELKKKKIVHIKLKKKKKGEMALVGNTPGPSGLVYELWAATTEYKRREPEAHRQCAQCFVHPRARWRCFSHL